MFSYELTEERLLQPDKCNAACLVSKTVEIPPQAQAVYKGCIKLRHCTGNPFYPWLLHVFQTKPLSSTTVLVFFSETQTL